MSLAKRIEEALKDAEISKTSLANQVGVSPSSVTQWLSGETKKLEGQNLLAAARALNVTPEWLATGKGKMRWANTAVGPDLRGKVPIISWVQAGDFSHAVDNDHPGGSEQWADTTVPIHRHTYALRVRGDSMTNPDGEPTFPDGQIIVVEPDAIDAPEKLVGLFVIVKRANDDEATFKQLVKDAGRYYLKPLNPSYRLIDLLEDDVFCGVVREKTVRYF